MSVQGTEMERLKEIQVKLLNKLPFYRILAMNMLLAVSNNPRELDTACTDGRHLIFDSGFMGRLSDEEVEVVFLHEVLHAALLHPFRQGARDHLLFNIAADITVNSIILKQLGLTDFEIDGSPMMHRLPDTKEEGYLYSVEEVYRRLLQNQKFINGLKLYLQGNPAEDDGEAGVRVPGFDSHDIWEQVKDDPLLRDELEKCMEEAAAMYGCGTVDVTEFRKYEEIPNRRAKQHWRQILRRFFTDSCSLRRQGTYGFRPPDRRFMQGSFVFPARNPSSGEELQDIDIFIDISGSISQKMIRTVMVEICGMLGDTQGVENRIHFFNHTMLDPVTVTNVHEVRKIGVPKTGGGTSFMPIFSYLEKTRRSKGAIVVTDGYADFPAKAPEHIPLLWVIVDSNVNPPIGQSVHIKSSTFEKP